MAQPYSEDFRQKVIDAIELNGLKKSEVSEGFGISRNTINRWYRQKAELGHLKANVRTTANPRAKIKDWDAFRSFVKQHQDKTQAEMAALWPDPISQRTMSRALQKIGFTRKKRPMATANETRGNGLSFKLNSAIQRRLIESMSMNRAWMSATTTAMDMPLSVNEFTTSNLANATGESI